MRVVFWCFELARGGRVRNRWLVMFRENFAPACGLFNVTGGVRSPHGDEGSKTLVKRLRYGSPMMWAFVYLLSHNGVKNFCAGFGHGSSLVFGFKRRHSLLIS